MSKINLGRVLLGGIVAGIVADILDYLVDGIWLAPRWSFDMVRLNLATIFSMKQEMAFNLIGIAGGIVAVWIYAAIRPRFGAGVRTAIHAGIVVWFLAALLPNIAMMYVTHLFSRGLTFYTTVGALVEIVVGTVAGAYLYKEA
jgi:hypothetical protein